MGSELCKINGHNVRVSNVTVVNGVISFYHNYCTCHGAGSAIRNYCNVRAVRHGHPSRGPEA